MAKKPQLQSAEQEAPNPAGLEAPINKRETGGQYIIEGGDHDAPAAADTVSSAGSVENNTKE